MRAWQKLLLVGLVLIAALAAGAPLAAQSVNRVTASVDRTAITTDDVLELVVNIEGQPDGAPLLPPIDGLRIVGSASQRSVSIVNGVTSAVATYRYRLVPTRTGTVQIDPIVVMFAGQPLQTLPIAIEITQGTQPLQPPPAQTIVPPTALTNQDFYVEATVDRADPYLGQQVRYIFRFYQAVELSDRPTYSPPDFVGFWNAQRSEQTQTLTDVSGRTYRVTSLITPLFPTIDGPRTIAPARFNLPNGSTLLTEPVTLTVRALPTPAPAGFSGAVGSYNIAAQVDPTSVAVGAPLRLRVTLSGAGNIDTLPEPAWPTLPGWRAFAERSSADSEFSNGILRGSRTYLRQLTPTAAGNFTLPPIAYTYFDPDRGSYETIATPPLALTVSGTAADADPAESGSAETIAAVELRPLQASDRLRRLTPDAAPGAAFWLLWLLPPLWLGGRRLWQQRRQQASAPAVTRAGALRAAQRALAAARRSGSRAADAAERILSSYLHDRFGLVVGSLTQAQLARELHLRDVPPATVQQVTHIYTTTAAIRFGQAPADDAALIDAVAAVVNQIDALEGA